MNMNMNMNHVQFQSLSSFEAQQIHRKVGKALIQAFESGMNLILTAHLRLDDLPEAMVEKLMEIGFDEASAREIALGSRIRISETKA